MLVGATLMWHKQQSIIIYQNLANFFNPFFKINEPEKIKNYTFKNLKPKCPKILMFFHLLEVRNLKKRYSYFDDVIQINNKKLLCVFPFFSHQLR